MCGGLGFVIGLIVFFGWRNSEKQWQKVIAYICGIWMAVSALFYFAMAVSY